MPRNKPKWGICSPWILGHQRLTLSSRRGRSGNTKRNSCQTIMVAVLFHIELQTHQQALQSKKRINSSIIQVCYWRVQLHHYGLWQWECYEDLLRLPRSTTRWMQHYQDLGHCQGFFHPPVSKKTWKGGSNMLIGDNTTNYLLTILSQSLWWLPKKSLCTSTLPCIDAKCRQNNGTPPPPTRKWHLYNIPIPMYAQALRV